MLFLLAILIMTALGLGLKYLNGSVCRLGKVRICTVVRRIHIRSAG